MSLVPLIPLSLQELLTYYKTAVRECEFIEAILIDGLGQLEVRMKPSPLLSVRFNRYEAYYVDFLAHLKWRLSDLCVDDGYEFAQSAELRELLEHEYKHSGIAHPIGEEEIVPMLESLDFVKTQLNTIITMIETSMLSSIFLCHSSQDKEFARRIASDLTKRGARVWLDEAEIDVGDSILEKIQHGIVECDFLGCVLSPRSVESIWVRKEVEAALMDEINLDRKKVLPLLIENCDVPPFLRAKKYADFTIAESYESGLDGLAKALTK